MAHVQARARGVGELDQGIELGLFMRFFRGEGVGVLPVLLPLLFHGVRGIGGYVLHLRRSSFSKIEAFRPQRDGRRCLSRYHSFLAIRPAFLPANGGVRAALAATLRDEFGSARRRLAPSGGSLGGAKKPTASHLRYGEIIDHLPPECQAKWVKYARGERRFQNFQCLLRAFLHAAQAENTVRGVLSSLWGVAYGKPHRAKGGRRRRPCPRARAETPSPGQTHLQKARLPRQTKANPVAIQRKL